MQVTPPRGTSKSTPFKTSPAPVASDDALKMHEGIGCQPSVIPMKDRRPHRRRHRRGTRRVPAGWARTSPGVPETRSVPWCMTVTVSQSLMTNSMLCSTITKVLPLLFRVRIFVGDEVHQREVDAARWLVEQMTSAPRPRGRPVPRACAGRTRASRPAALASRASPRSRDPPWPRPVRSWTISTS